MGVAYPWVCTANNREKFQQMTVFATIKNYSTSFFEFGTFKLANEHGEKEGTSKCTHNLDWAPLIILINPKIRLKS